MEGNRPSQRDTNQPQKDTAMKAIIHVCESAPGLAALKHNYRGHASRSKPERYFQDSRVQAVVGDTCGIGVVPLKPGKEKSLLELLSGPNGKRIGKSLRQIIFSAEDLPDDKPDGYYAMILAQLLKAAKKWIDKYAPGCRWAAWAHEDREHPHVHVVVENWDYARGKRLNLSPSLLEEMQGMEFCADLGIESGRGSRGQIEAGLVLLSQGKPLAECTYQERIQVQAAVKDNARMAVAAQIESWRKRLDVPLDIVAMQLAMEQDELPEGWRALTRLKNGNLRAKPTVIVGGVSVRLDKFMGMRERLPSLVTQAPTPDTTVVEVVIAEPVLTAPFVEESTPEPTPAPVVADPVVEIHLGTDSVMAEPAVVEPAVVMETIVAEPIVAEPVVVEPTPEPTPAPVVADLVVEIPLGTDSVMAEPVVVEPTVVMEPVLTEPVVAEPLVVEPAVAVQTTVVDPTAKPTLGPIGRPKRRQRPNDPPMEI